MTLHLTRSLNLQRARRNPRLAGWTVWLVALSMGCQSFPRSTAQLTTADGHRLAAARATINDVQGPSERRLRAQQWERQRQELLADPNSEFSQAYARLEAAQELYDTRKYREAEKAFKQLAKDRRKTYESFQVRLQRWWGTLDAKQYDPYTNFGDPVEEDALFMAAESQFAQMRYAAAQDSYDDLLNRYPNSRHVDRVMRQLFRIARHWLDFPEDVDDSGDAKVRVASAEQSRASSGLNTKAIAVLPNLTDRSRPTFDTYGRGLQALKSIWLHDATGPLADDALMLTANHYLRRENFVEAARHLSLLRDQYPDSPHFQDAFILGSHVALASYEGAAYDPSGLHEAISLKETTLQVFPDLDREQRRKMEQEIEKLREAEIARLWEIVDFYRRKRIPESMALYCYLIINKYPESRYAELARETLREIEPQLQQQSGGGFWLFRRAVPTPAGSPEQSQPSGRLSLPAETDEPSRLSGETTEAPRRGMFGFLRRADSPPQLQQVPDLSTSDASPGRVGL